MTDLRPPPPPPPAAAVVVAADGAASLARAAQDKAWASGAGGAARMTAARWLRWRTARSSRRLLVYLWSVEAPNLDVTRVTSTARTMYNCTCLEECAQRRGPKGEGLGARTPPLGGAAAAARGP